MEKFSVLIPSYREYERLHDLVKTILEDELSKKIQKIVVVTPDKNVKLPNSRKIKLINEKMRKGKSKAIDIGLKEIDTDIIVMLSSDLKMRKNFLNGLLTPFNNKKIGMVIGRPKADKNSNIYPLSKIIWDLHHILCKKTPKGTEICAFRKIVNRFPRVNADEVFIEYEIKKIGMKIIYRPSATGRTRIPNNLTQLFKQRKRIFNGHLQMKEEYNFNASSMDTKLLFEIVTEFLKSNFSIKNTIMLSFLSILEIIARFSAMFDFYVLKNVQTIW